MAELIKIDRKSDTPVYRQIIERITARVRDGSLVPGDKLPPERDLASSLGIARGTITRAYEELARMNVIEVVQGRGSFVSARQDVVRSGRKEKAEALIRDLLDRLTSLRFTFREARAMVDLAILEREESLASLNVAAVDCNPEALGIWERQLGFLSRVSVRKFLLDELAHDPDPARRLGDFELVITTSTHYSELLGMVPALRERITQVGVSPSQQTIISLAALKPAQSIGILCESRQFLQIIRGKLRELGIRDKVEQLLVPAGGLEAESLGGFLEGIEVLVAAPGFRAVLPRDLARELQRFDERGGAVVSFDYQIERGSLVHLEERIRDLAGRAATTAGA